MKTWLKRIAAILMLAAVTGAFFGLPTSIACKVQPSASWTFLGVLLLTPLVGRLFCETMCPLGTIQSVLSRIVRPKTAVRRVCTRLPQTKAQIAARWAVLAAFAALVACGFGGIAWSVTPYAIFGKALTLSAVGLGLFTLVAVLVFFGKGRVWCNWICPAGTLFNLLSWRSVLCHKVGPGCANCRVCFPKKETARKEDAPAGQNAAKEPADANQGEGVTRRETLQGMAVIAAVGAAEKTTDGGLAEVSLPGRPSRTRAVLPPGAKDADQFARLCVGCGLCASNCPGGAISLSTSLNRFGQAELSFDRGHCLAGCPQRCAEVCPAGAISLLEGVPRKDIHIGCAVWSHDLCIRATDGVECKACSRKCPVKAIHIVEGFPVVDREACIGCGACEHVCPARPMPAIHVNGYDSQHVVRPYAESETLAEMIALVKRGMSVVCAKDGVIVDKAEGQGVSPLLDLLDRGSLDDATVVDKVIGRAAAAICIAGRAQRVHALTMSYDASDMLNSAGIDVSAEAFVERILNRKKDDLCPLEQTVADSRDPREMVTLLRRKAAALKNGGKAKPGKGGSGK